MKTLDRIIEIENKLNLNGGKGSGWWNPDHAMRVSAMFHSPAMERAFKQTKSRTAILGLVNSRSAYPTSRDPRTPTTDAARDVVNENAKNGITSTAGKDYAGFSLLFEKRTKDKVNQDDEDFFQIKQMATTIADEALNGKEGLGPSYVKSRFSQMKKKIEMNIKYDKMSQMENFITYYDSKGKKISKEESSEVKQNLIDQLDKALKELYR